MAFNGESVTRGSSPSGLRGEIEGICYNYRQTERWSGSQAKEGLVPAYRPSRPFRSPGADIMPPPPSSFLRHAAHHGVASNVKMKFLRTKTAATLLPLPFTIISLSTPTTGRMEGRAEGRREGHPLLSASPSCNEGVCIEAMKSEHAATSLESI